MAVRKEGNEAKAGQKELAWLDEFYEKWVGPELAGRDAEQSGEAERDWQCLADARARLSEALSTGENEGSPFVGVLREFAFAEAMYDRVIRRTGAVATADGESAAGRVDGFVDGFAAGFELAYFLAFAAEKRP